MGVPQYMLERSQDNFWELVLSNNPWNTMDVFPAAQSCWSSMLFKHSIESILLTQPGSWTGIRSLGGH